MKDEAMMVVAQVYEAADRKTPEGTDDFTRLRHVHLPHSPHSCNFTHTARRSHLAGRGRRCAAGGDALRSIPPVLRTAVGPIWCGAVRRRARAAG